jgi:hypothetical protein
MKSLFQLVKLLFQGQWQLYSTLRSYIVPTRFIAPLAAAKLGLRARIFKCLRSPGTDSKKSIPTAYVARRAGTITLFVYRLEESIPWSRFLGSLNVYKFGLWHGGASKGRELPETSSLHI